MKGSKLLHRLAAVATIAATYSDVADAFASTSNLRTLTSNISVASGGLPNMISMFAYIAGTGLGVLGVFKIKQHVDAPSNVPLKDGVMRLGAAGMLLSLPFMTEVVRGSISNGNTQATSTNNLIVSQNLNSFQ